MTPSAVQVTVTYDPATPQQMAAWKWLWGRILREEHLTPTGKVEVRHANQAQASAHGGDPDGTPS
jgi:hypothetical protein